jgi:transposase
MPAGYDARPARPYKPKMPKALSLKEQEMEEKRKQARQLYLLGMSYRDIAERIGLSENGYVTISRWVKRFGWQAERDELEKENKVTRRNAYLHRVSTIQDAHLRLAEKVRKAAELALDGYIITDEQGQLTGIKIHPRTGLPAISPTAIQLLIMAATDLERKALGVELLPTEEMQQLAEPVVDATPLDEAHLALLRQMGDFLAQRSLDAASDATASEASDAAPTSPHQTPDADAPPETVGPDTERSR